MLDPQLREQMNKKRQELYEEAEQRQQQKEAYRDIIQAYFNSLLDDKDISEFLELSKKRVIFLKSKEGVQCSDQRESLVYALARSSSGLEKYAGPLRYSKKREFSLVGDMQEAVHYVVALGEQRGKFIEVAEILEEIEKGIEKLLKNA